MQPGEPCSIGIGQFHTCGTIGEHRAFTAGVDEHDGADAALARMAALHPQVVFANELEAAVLGEGLRPDRLGGATVIVKRGPGPATLLRAGEPPIDVAALTLTEVKDTTGAGDAFAAGVLLALADGADAVAAVQHGHDVAAASLRAR